MDRKRMKILEFDDEGRPTDHSQPGAVPRASVESAGLVTVVTFDDEPASDDGVERSPGRPAMKIREFDGSGGTAAAGSAASTEPRRSGAANMKIMEFDDNVEPGQRGRAPGRRDMKIVEFD